MVSKMKKIYQDKQYSAEKRAEDLLHRLTLDEKLGMLNMYNQAVPRLGIPEYHWWNEGLHGVARNGKATMFPQAIAVAATFTPEFAYEMGKITGEEARIKHHYYAQAGQRGIYCGVTIYAPNINIFRDPRWGRGHETFGECPVLTALMGTAYIKGIQTPCDGYIRCGATLKHFAVHSGPERIRSSFNVNVSEYDLQQTYLYAFHYCLKHGGVKSFMTSYNSLHQVPMSVNKEMLQDILREKWKFDGVTVTDVGTAKYLVEEYKVCKDMPEALAMEIAAGVDVCCELAPEINTYFSEAYNRGILKENDIDRAVRNQLILKFQLGLFDSQDELDYYRLECREHREISRRIAERSIVLLKNNGILPLQKESFNKVAVIGPTADDIEVLRGNYAGTASKYVTILDGIQELFGADNVIYARGCEVIREKTELCGAPGDRLAEAFTAAKFSDLVILAVGLTPEFEGENGDAGNSEAAGDKNNLDLPVVQQQLMDIVLKAGKPLLLLNCSGSAVIIPEDKADAVLQIFYPGPEGGRAVADILTGKVNPSGRLPITFYKSTDKLPPFEDYSMQNRTYRYCQENIKYPFGYGLSYTEFEYSELTAQTENSTFNDIACSVKVRNSGKYAGETVVLFFFRHEDRKDDEPLKQFAGSVRISLASGESKKVFFTYAEELLQTVDKNGNFKPLSGRITLIADNQTLTVNRT